MSRRSHTLLKSDMASSSYPLSLCGRANFHITLNHQHSVSFQSFKGILRGKKFNQSIPIISAYVIFQQVHCINTEPMEKISDIIFHCRKGHSMYTNIKIIRIDGKWFHSTLRVHLDRVNRIQRTQKHRVQVIVQIQRCSRAIHSSRERCHRWRVQGWHT